MQISNFEKITKTLLLFLVFGVFALQSCRKDPSDPFTPAVEKHLDNVQYLYPGQDTVTEHFNLDNQGRLTLYDDSFDSSVVHYTGNQIEITEYRKEDNNRIVFQFTGTVDGAGRVTGGTATGNYNINTIDNRQISMEYDAEGYLKKSVLSIDNGNSYEVHYFWENGNLVRTESFTNGSLDYKFLYEYGAGNTDRTPFGQYAHLPAPVNTGKRNKEMWTKFTRKRDGYADFIGFASYTHDADGYISKQQIEYSDGSSYTVLYNFK